MDECLVFRLDGGPVMGDPSGGAGAMTGRSRTWSLLEHRLRQLHPTCPSFVVQVKAIRSLCCVCINPVGLEQTNS